MNKFIAYLCLFALISTNLVYADTTQDKTLVITDKAYKKTTKSTKISGTAPVVADNKAINDQIDKIVALLESEALDNNASALELSYSVVESSVYNTTSILIQSTTASASADGKVSTLVIDNDSKNILGLNDILGQNSVKLCNGVVIHYINQKYKGISNFDSLNEGSDYYLKEDVLYLIFDKYEIAPGSEGIIEIPFYPDKVTNYTIEKSEYYYTDKYNVRMIPLRSVAVNFNYQLQWNAITQEITLTSTIKNTVANKTTGSVTLNLNKNSYKRSSDLSESQLELAPEIKDDFTYVPISFMEVILDLYYYSDANGSIIFSMYNF